MNEENHLIAERREKISDLEKSGFISYAQKFDRTHTAAKARVFCEKTSLREVNNIVEKPIIQASLCGRIINFRSMGKLAFLKIRDVSGDFQVCLMKNLLGENFKKFEKLLDLGDFCGFEGEFFMTKHGEPTLLATKVMPLSKALRSLPEKFHGLTNKEACYRQRYLDLLTNDETFNRFQVRSEVVRLIRNFLHAKQFTEVETRTLQSQAGGAMAKVFETHHNALDHDFVLRISLELEHKMLLAGRFERVFEIGKCFRNEGIDPSHLQEFTLLEWYAAYADITDNMNWTQEMIQEIIPKVLGSFKCSVLDKNEKEVEIDWSGEWPRIKFEDLLKKYAKIDMGKITLKELRTYAVKNCELSNNEAIKMGRGNLLDHIYKKTARPNLIQPTFVIDWPTDLKPLARPNEDGTSDVYQLLVAGWEIVNSYGELIDPRLQRKLLEEQAAAKEAGDEDAMEVDEEFLTAMEYGFPPMTGFGMGIDRFVALITEQPNLRDVVLHPLLRPEKTVSSIKKSDKTMLAVAIINTSANLERWQELNAVGHLTAAFGAREGLPLLEFDTIQTRDEADIALNIQHAILIKSGNNTSLKELREKAKENDLHIAEFTREMLETTDDTKVKSITATKDLSDIEHLGLLVYGPKKVVEKLTKQFSLFS